VLARCISWILNLTTLMAVLAAPALADGKRVALVVGNSKYMHSAELRNPHNDARDVAASLEKLGFTVISEFDLDRIGMGRAIGRFGVAIENATVAVFYFAGHGMQLHGTNYLVPTDSKLENHYSPELELMSVATVQRLMESKPRTNIIFLDACRDNPLARNLARSMGTRSTAVQLGLSRIEAGNGTLISFSTQPGAVALDGTGRNSPFAEALVRQLDSSSLSIADMLIDVRRDVRIATKDRQITWEHSSLSERFYFAPPKPVVVVPPAVKRQEEQAKLARQLNRELRRVGCDPGTSGDTWTVASQEALQQFAAATKLALHTDEPTQAALDALTTQKIIVCPVQPAALARVPEKPVEQPVAATPPPAIAPPAPPTPVAATPPPKFVAPPALTEPAAVAPPAADVSPPAATVAPVVVAPTPPAAVALPVPTAPPTAAPPPATAKPSKPEPRPLPRAAAVKTSPPPPAAAQPAPQPAPFATSIQREGACRIETEEECKMRSGLANNNSNSICPIAARIVVCPGSRPAAARPPPARTVERDKNCRLESIDECMARTGMRSGAAFGFIGNSCAQKTICK